MSNLDVINGVIADLQGDGGPLCDEAYGGYPLLTAKIFKHADIWTVQINGLYVADYPSREHAFRLLSGVLLKLSVG